MPTVFTLGYEGLTVVDVRRLASFDAGRSKTYFPEEVFDQD